jgi:hypothetical protein
MDTFEVYYFNGGCFPTDNFASVRKISFFKNNTNYLVKYSELPRGNSEIKLSYKTKQIGYLFFDNINSFYHKTKAENEKRKRTISTNNAYMYIRIGNNIFSISDSQFLIGNFYDHLIDDIIKS